MARMGRLIFIILILVAAIVWVTQVHPVFATANAGMSLPLS